MLNNSFIRDNFNMRQLQHRLCTQHIVRSITIINQPDFAHDQYVNDSESDQSINFENQLQTSSFKTLLFKQLISSAVSSVCASFSTSENEVEVLYIENNSSQELYIQLKLVEKQFQ
ncbi:Hypothetical_protein [Hexamita inflata]|uniref:Hypothetical_protein n=1 Tax=Hexamita inflata TaxID=28002 RepID=A0ABP1HEB6_9EUKA